jgi:hypothetical protein
MQSIAGVRNRNTFLKEPFILKDVRAVVVLDLIPNDVPRIGRRDFHHLDAVIGVKFASLHIQKPCFRQILVLYLKIARA